MKTMLCKKMVFFFFVLSSHFVFSETPDTTKDHYDVAIGLGTYCQTARQMSNCAFRYQAFPFDWVISPFDSVFEFIANRAKNFMDKDTLGLVTGKRNYMGVNHPYIEDKVYHIQFIHDFETGPNFLKDYDVAKAKYDRRVSRFFEAIDSNKKILFIRHGITYLQAVMLDQLLHTRYPQLSYTILALDNTEEMKRDWGLERIKNYYLRQLEPWNWEGDYTAWKEILKNFSVKVMQHDDYNM